MISGISSMFYCSENGDDRRAAAALADNTAALLLFSCCCHFARVCPCAYACGRERDADVKRVNDTGSGRMAGRAAFS